MFAQQAYLLGPDAVVFLANLAMASCLVSGLGLLAVRVWRSRAAAIRHDLLLATIALLAVSPILLAVAAPRGWFVVPLSLSAGDGGDCEPPSVGEAEKIVLLPTAAGGATLRAGEGGADRPANHSWKLWQVVATAAACVWALEIAARSLRLLRRLRTLRYFLRTLAPARTVPLGTKECPGPEVGVYESPFTPIPLAVGLLRPVIVLPTGLADELPWEHLRLVVRHEDAHVRRRDPWAALLQWASVTLFWWNPLVRVVGARLSLLREQLCDAHAARSAGEGRLLAEALLRVAERVVRADRFPSVALLDGDVSDLEERVRGLLAPAGQSGWRSLSGRVVVGAFLALVSSLLLVGGLRAIHPAASSSRDASTAGTPGWTALRTSSEKALSLDRDGTDQGEIAPPDAIAGWWLLTLPRGFRHRITLTALGKGRYRFEPRNLVMSGVYVVQDGKLVIVEPNDKRLTGFTWQLQRDGSLTLIGEPGVAKTGSSYLKAVMRRLAN